MSSAGMERTHPRAGSRYVMGRQIRALTCLFGVLATASWCGGQTIEVTPDDATTYRFFGYEGGPFTAESATSWTIKNIDNPGYNHYAIKVNDIEGACSELMEGGLPVDGPVYVEATGRKLATVRDPNGFLVQLVEINDVNRKSK